MNMKENTHECWLVKEPVKVTREDYRWHSPDARICKDKYGNIVPKITGTFEPLPMVNDGRIRDFIEFCHVDKEVEKPFYDIIRV